MDFSVCAQHMPVDCLICKVSPPADCLICKTGDRGLQNSQKLGEPPTRFKSTWPIKGWKLLQKRKTNLKMRSIFERFSFLCKSQSGIPTYTICPAYLYLGPSACRLLTLVLKHGALLWVGNGSTEFRLDTDLPFTRCKLEQVTMYFHV